MCTSIYPENYRHKLENQCVKDIEKILVATDALSDIYTDVVEQSLLPDIIGKSVRVSPTQFPNVYKMIHNMSSVFMVKPPPAFVIESLYYDVNIEGLSAPWLQISAKTIFDLSDEQLSFLIARQIAHLQCGHQYYETMFEQMMRAFDILEQSPVAILNTVGLLDGTQITYKLVMSKWSRISELTADAGAFLYCDCNLDVAISSILTTIFNNTQLVKEINISEYIKEAKNINSLNSVMANYSKMDELVPYGPFRIQELIRFASVYNNKMFRS